MRRCDVCEKVASWWGRRVVVVVVVVVMVRVGDVHSR